MSFDPKCYDLAALFASDLRPDPTEEEKTELAHDITIDQGRHWAVVAAMARATTDQDPQAIRVIREHAAATKRA